MIITEHPYNGDENFIRTVSDAGKLILQNETGRKYINAVDLYPSRYTYTETDEHVPKLNETEA